MHAMHARVADADGCMHDLDVSRSRLRQIMQMHQRALLRLDRNFQLEMGCGYEWVGNREIWQHARVQQTLSRFACQHVLGVCFRGQPAVRISNVMGVEVTHGLPMFRKLMRVVSIPQMWFGHGSQSPDAGSRCQSG
jgi:hypothetical protein